MVERVDRDGCFLLEVGVVKLNSEELGAIDHQKLRYIAHQTVPTRRSSLLFFLGGEAYLCVFCEAEIGDKSRKIKFTRLKKTTFGGSITVKSRRQGSIG